MVEHVLKTAAVYFDAIERGEKNFEVRRDDRGFQKGDILVLERCYDADHYERFLCGQAYEVDRDFNGSARHSVRKRVTFILTGGQLGIEPGYVVMALTDPDP